MTFSIFFFIPKANLIDNLDQELLVLNFYFFNRFLKTKGPVSIPELVPKNIADTLLDQKEREKI